MAVLLQIQFRKIPVGEEVVIEELVQRTKGFSGAEVRWYAVHPVAGSGLVSRCRHTCHFDVQPGAVTCSSGMR